ncbi:MAG TPA: hypothetical protein VHS53_04485 [Mucilaginibacter sp.]|nr:hypothetical protein [Mucilaginibacter sp.]
MKKWYWIPVGVIVILIATNPSVGSFKAYLGESSYYGLKRTQNYFVCSVYKHGHKPYLGIVGNFFDLYSPHKIVSVSQIDSTKMADSARVTTVDTVKDPLGILKKK